MKALRSASGQNSIGSDRTLVFAVSTCCAANAGKTSGRIVEPDMLTDDLAECLVCLSCLQPTVEVDCGLDIEVAKQPLDGFVVARVVLEIDRCTGMAELMDRYPHARRLLDALLDLGAKHVRRLRLTGDAGKQPG